MTMDTDSFDSFEGLFDSYDSSDYAERSRNRGRPWNRGVPTPSQGSSMARRPTGNFVTEGQLNAAVDKLDGKINTLSGGVRTLEGRTNTIASEQDRLGSALRKEIEERKKSLEAVQKDLGNTKMVSLLLPFLTQRPVPVDSKDGKTQVLTQPNDSLTTLLPFLLLMGSGSSGSSGSGMFGDNSSMLLFAVLLSRR